MLMVTTDENDLPVAFDPELVIAVMHDDAPKGHLTRINVRGLAMEYLYVQGNPKDVARQINTSIKEAIRRRSAERRTP